VERDLGPAAEASLTENGVNEPGLAERGVRRQEIAAVHVLGGHREVHGQARRCNRLVEDALVDAKLAGGHRMARPRARENQRVASPDLARRERAGDDRARATDREDTVDPEPRRSLGASHWKGTEASGHRLAELAYALPGRRRARDDRHDELLLEQLSRFFLCQGERLVVDEVALGERHHGVGDSELLADPRVLARLRHDPFVRGDHEEDQLDPGCPRDHRVDESPMPRHVHDGGGEVVAQAPRRKSELDADPAALLLRQAIGVDAGQRLHERGLAVIDVPRGADDEGPDHARLFSLDSLDRWRNPWRKRTGIEPA